MGYLAVMRAIAVRLLFTAHSVISIWRLALITNDNRFYYLYLVLCLLLIEMTITLGKKAGQEWKWFCPSVFIYLLCIVPTIWFMELHELENRIREHTKNISTTTDSSVDTTSGNSYNNNSSSNLTSNSYCPCRTSIHGDIGGEFGEKRQKENITIDGFLGKIKVPIMLSSDEWIRTLEQILLLILILGRWFLPKGKLTHDQLSQLLLVYIGTAADIVEFFEAFKEETVRYNRTLCIVILGIWTMSLIQFSLVLTASRARRDRTGLVPITHSKGRTDTCCNPDVYGILISICLQDLPFLVLRLILIFKYFVLSYTNMFFTCKNTIVIILLIYRLVVVHMERRRLAQKEKEETESAVRISMLMHTTPYHGSSPTVFKPGARRGVGSGYTNGGNVMKVTGYGSGQKFLGGVGGGSSSRADGEDRMVILEGGTIRRGGGGLIGADRETGGNRGISTLGNRGKYGNSNGQLMRLVSLDSSDNARNKDTSGQEKMKLVGERQAGFGGSPDSNIHENSASTSRRSDNNNSYIAINADDRNSPV
ncbi:transmembrane protein [Plakobranchus ocellatus]|uniref:Transmembrane protein n=1 Tax=Plakobranchus ocellatus TaxID=259542 RepID=A0AAV4CVY4_9GAST|nr:transmembrane protein [Plakobranchus ocellatus]